MSSLNRRSFLAASAVPLLVTMTCASTPSKRSARRPLAVSSRNGRPALTRAMDLLHAGADPLEAIVDGVTLVEEDPDDMSVGYGGLPNEQGVVDFNEEVLTEDDEDWLALFNPFTDTPIECPQGAAAATCEDMGAHWQKGENFGLPDTEGDYQTPQTFRFSLGFRF